MFRLKQGINKVAEAGCPGTVFYHFPAPPPSPGSVSVRVNAGSDDAEQNLTTGTASTSSNDLELIYDGVNQIVGLRFNNISIPPNSVITNAYLEFQADAAHSGATSLTIKGQAADNPTTFTTVANNISTRPKTTASVAWNSLPAWVTGTKYQSPDITSVVQEIVSRPGWANGNSMVMLVEGSGRREAESYEGLAASAPLLVIQYDYTPTEICSNGVDDDSDGLVDAADPDCGAFCSAGSISFQRWTGISGSSISNLTSNANYPNSPNQTGTLASFDGPDNYADNYGTRLRGYVSVTQTGLYTFNLTSDDAGELYLSTSAAAAGKVLIASVSGWTDVTEYTKYAAQTSANMPLVAGRKYYIELLQKEGSGADHFQVYWKTPSSSTWTIVPGGNLRPFVCGEICTNGADDDGDGLVDCADSDCLVPTASISGTNTICAGGGTTLTASGGGTYAWSTGATTAAITVSPASTTTYTVTVTGSSGCTATSTRTVTVNALPTASISGTNTICAGGSTTLTASGGGTYFWSTGASTAAITVNPATTTTYGVTVTNASGCTATSARTVTVNALPTASISGTNTICAGGSTTLTASGGGTYFWNTGATTAAITVNPATTTTYGVTVTNASGCTATSTRTVTVNALPTASISGTNTICAGGSTTLTAGGGGTYSWSTGATTAAITVSPVFNTTYTVTVTSTAGCTATAARTVTVSACLEICNNSLDDDNDGLTDCADTDCGPSANAGSNVNICAGTSTLLSAAASGGVAPYSFNWDNGLGAGANHTVSPVATTTYTVTVTSASGCTAVDNVVVTVVACPENCTDGLDNDGDGLVDCADPDCQLVGQPILADDEYETCPGVVFVEQPIFNDQNLQNSQYSIFTNPTAGAVSINSQGVFTYTPSGSLCGVDSFRYQVCNAASGCCDQATVTLLIGNTEPPELKNFPADITINCDESVPPTPAVYGIDDCPGIFLSFEETDDQINAGSCQNYTITRTWEATDQCGNSVASSQTINVRDLDVPEIYRVYTLANGKKLLAGISTTQTEWAGVRFPISFDAVPLIFTQVVTANAPNAVAVRLGNIHLEGFEIIIMEEEAGDGVHAAESVAWMAVEPGALSDSSNLQADLLNNVTHAFTTLNFAQPFAAAPVFISSAQTTNETDPFEIRLKNASSSSIQLHLEEEDSFDGEKNHGNENVAYLAVKAGPVADENDDFAAEAGTVSLNNAWETVTLGRRFTKPVVLFGGQPTGNDPATIRVRNVTANSFEVRIQEWDYLDGSLPDRAVGFVVVEGSIPAFVEDPCQLEQTEILPGVNLFAVDNCDDQLDFEHSEVSVLTSSGLVKTHSWVAADDCGNEAELNRSDTCYLAAVRLRASLYGAMIATYNSPYMRDNLRTNGYIPLAEPYTNLPEFQHWGEGGGETTTQQLLDVTGPDAIVDWVFVEIRDPDIPEEVIATVAALLQSNGDVVTSDGDTMLLFPGVQQGYFYVAIRHRNHLGMMSATTKFLNIANVPLVDFVLATESTNGGTDAGHYLNGNRNLWSGDLNGDRMVIYQGPNNDVFTLFSEVMADDNNVGNLANFIKEGYLNADLNMDGMAIYQGPNNDRALLLYHSILVNPANPSYLANFIAAEKLP